MDRARPPRAGAAVRRRGERRRPALPSARRGHAPVPHPVRTGRGPARELSAGRRSQRTDGRAARVSSGVAGERNTRAGVQRRTGLRRATAAALPGRDGRGASPRAVALDAGTHGQAARRCDPGDHHGGRAGDSQHRTDAAGRPLDLDRVRSHDGADGRAGVSADGAFATLCSPRAVQDMTLLALELATARQPGISAVAMCTIADRAASSAGAPRSDWSAAPSSARYRCTTARGRSWSPSDLRRRRYRVPTTSWTVWPTRFAISARATERYR